MTMRDILVEDYNDDSEDFLVHYGILGMKWGIRRYQNEDGSYTRAGEMRRRKSFRLETKEEKAERLARKSVKKAVRQVKKAEQAAKREEKREQRSAEEQVKLEKKKFQILRSGDADRIYKNQHLFTDQELNTALNRLRQNEQVRQMGKGYQKEQERSRKESQKQSDKQKQNQQAKQQTKNGKSAVQKLWDAGKMAVGVYATYNQIAKGVNQITGQETLPNFGSGTSFRQWQAGRQNVSTGTAGSNTSSSSNQQTSSNTTTGQTSSRPPQSNNSAHQQSTSRSGSSNSGSQATYNYNAGSSSRYSYGSGGFTQWNSQSGGNRSSSSSSSRDSVINMSFDAATGSYTMNGSRASSSGYDWASAMNRPIRGLI